MTVKERVINILTDILDIPEEDINDESYLARDLNAESIDLLEIAVTLGSEFSTDIDDDEIFLKNLRLHIEETEHKEKLPEVLLKKYAFLDHDRIMEILNDLENGPVLKVKDLVLYMMYKRPEQ